MYQYRKSSDGIVVVCWYIREIHIFQGFILTVSVFVKERKCLFELGNLIFCVII